MAGKFDQYRRDLEFNAVHLVFRALGRLLLAEPEDELAELRGRIVGAVGANAGLLTAAIPEFAALLAVPPDPGDPLTAQVRARRTGVEVLRAVASRKRPVVVFVDDLQWAKRSSLDFVDLVLSEEPIEGLLLVGAYRDGDCGRGASAGGVAVPMAGPGRRAAPAAGQPARAEPGHPGCRDAARRSGRGGGPGRADQPVHVRESVRDGGAAQRAAPRRSVDRDGRRVAVGQRGRARPSGRIRGGRAAGGSRRCHAANVAATWWRRWRAWAGGPS